MQIPLFWDRMKHSIIINLLGAPSSGKSTFSYGLMYFMKSAGLNVEFAAEFAKDLVYSNRFEDLGVQEYVFGEQLKRVQTLNGKVDYIVTDSPLLLSALYGTTTSLFKENVMLKFEQFDNIIFKLKYDENSIYDPNGRINSHKESILIDNKIEGILRSRNYVYTNIDYRTYDPKMAVSLIKNNQIIINTKTVPEQNTRRSNGLWSNNDA